MLKTFEPMLSNSYISDDKKQVKLKEGFRPLFSTYVQSIQKPITQKEIREVYNDKGAPRLSGKIRGATKGIQNAQMRDYETEMAIDDIAKHKAAKEHKYHSTTEQYNFGFTGDEEIDKEIRAIDDVIKKFGIPKKQQEKVKKELLKRLYANTVAKQFKNVTLRQLVDPITGQQINNKQAQLNQPQENDEDEDGWIEANVNNLLKEFDTIDELSKRGKRTGKRTGKKQKNNWTPTTIDTIQPFDQTPVKSSKKASDMNIVSVPPSPAAKYINPITKNPIMFNGRIFKGLIRDGFIIQGGDGNFHSKNGKLVQPVLDSDEE